MSAVDAAAHSDPEDIRALLATQLARPVRWGDTVRAVLATGVEALIECGPGKVLTGLNRRIERRANLACIALEDPAAISMPRSPRAPEPPMLDNELALVTGASRGIGRAIALALARAGARVVGTATSEAGASHITAMFAAAGVQGRGTVLDAGDAGSIEALVGDLENAEGLPTILVNNAAITRDMLLLRMKSEDWDQVIGTNLTAVFRISKACVRRMLKERRGRIINVASIVGATGNPGQTNYAAAKAGLIGFTKSLAREVGSRGITVNAVAPGFIDTDMTRSLTAEQRGTLQAQIPLGRLGAPEDIAAAVLFLASPQAAYITGETLHVNGGMYMA